MEDVKIKTTPQIATLRSGAFQKVEDPTEGEVVAKEVKVADDVIKAKITESVKKSQRRSTWKKQKLSYLVDVEWEAKKTSH